MPKFKIRYGISEMREESEIIEAADLDEALDIAAENADGFAIRYIFFEAEPLKEEKS